MDFYEDVGTVISNEKDFSNIIPTVENISILIQYCDQIYNQFVKLIEDDENRNSKIKYELQNYSFKKCFGEGLEIIIREKNFNTITCKNYNSYIELYKNGQLNNLDSLEVNLELNYQTGMNGSLITHENLFKIKFRPYEISFIRKSNFKNFNMERIENTIIDILQKFPVANTIFCTK